MKLSKLFTLMFGLSLLPHTPCMGATQDLQGNWKIVSMPDGWKKVPGVDVLVDDDQIQIRCGAVVTSKLNYTMNASRGTIDAFKAGEESSGVQRAIFRMSGDTITISVGARGKTRPESADSTEGGAMKWVLRRVSRK